MQPTCWDCSVRWGLSQVSRSFKLFAVAVLAVMLAVPSLAHAQPTPGIHINKVNTNGDTKTQFTFQIFNDQVLLDTITLTGAGVYAIAYPTPGLWTILEVTPPGWHPASTECHYIGIHGGTCTAGPGTVAIVYVGGDVVGVKFTNSLEASPVGGVVESVNKLTVLGPWSAVIVLVGCIGTVVVVAKKPRP